jgi:alpha 1,2-mannosyltransferase
MEVFLASMEEYEEYICEGVLPSLNARCIVLTDILEMDRSSDIIHSQLKSFALLFSSFEEVLWLDPGCFTLYDPAQLFKSEPFKSTGMIAWPDFWASTVSPLFYKISSQSTPSTSLRASTDAGKFLVSKKKHQESLLLMSYYTYYGRSHYNQLLSQANPSDAEK